MKRFALAALILTAFAGQVVAQFLNGSPSPVTMYVGNGELNASALGQANPAGHTLRTPTFPSTTALIITTWQSNIQTAASGTYTVTQSTNYNFNIYDGKIYDCLNPVLGTANDTSLAPSGNSANCQINDSLIAAGTYTHVIVAPIAIGGSLCSDWVSGALRKRITVLGVQLARAGLTAGTGFTGQTWILAHGGESDKNSGTPQATLATCIRNYAAAFTTEGITGYRFFVPTESMTANTTGANVTGAQADAVASGCTTCRQGFNVDSLTGGTNRQADGTHLTATGAINLAAGDVGIIQVCKAGAC